MNRAKFITRYVGLFAIVVGALLLLLRLFGIHITASLSMMLICFPCILMIIGSVLVIFSFRDEENARAVKFSLPTFIVLFFLTLAGWNAMRANELEQVQTLVNARAEAIKNLTQNYLRNISSSVDRIDKRWEAQGGTPEILWKADAQAYINDYPLLRAILWADSQSTVHWVVSNVAYNRIGFNMESEPSRASAIKKAKETGKGQITKTVDLLSGGKGFLYISPLYVDQRYDGFIATVFGYNDLFDTLLKENSLLNGFYFTVSENENFVYSNAPDYKQNEFSSEIDVDIANRVWNFRVTPKPEFFLSSQKSKIEFDIVRGALQNLIAVK